MRKLRLTIEDLQVDSFRVDPHTGESRGTVRGAAGDGHFTLTQGDTDTFELGCRRKETEDILLCPGVGGQTLQATECIRTNCAYTCIAPTCMEYSCLPTQCGSTCFATSPCQDCGVLA